MTRLERINLRISVKMPEFLNLKNIDEAIAEYNSRNRYMLEPIRKNMPKSIYRRNAGGIFAKTMIEKYGITIEETMELRKHIDFYFVQSGNTTMLIHKDYERNGRIGISNLLEHRATLPEEYYYAIMDKDIQPIDPEKIRELLHRVTK